MEGEGVGQNLKEENMKIMRELIRIWWLTREQIQMRKGGGLTGGGVGGLLEYGGLIEILRYLLRSPE